MAHDRDNSILNNQIAISSNQSIFSRSYDQIAISFLRLAIIDLPLTMNVSL